MCILSSHLIIRGSCINATTLFVYNYKMTAFLNPSLSVAGFRRCDRFEKRGRVSWHRRRDVSQQSKSRIVSTLKTKESYSTRQSWHRVVQFAYVAKLEDQRNFFWRNFRYYRVFTSWCLCFLWRKVVVMTEKKCSVVHVPNFDMFVVWLDFFCGNRWDEIREERWKVSYALFW